MRPMLIVAALLVTSVAVSAIGPEDPLTPYWHSKMEIQLSPVAVPDPANPGQVINVFRAEDMVKFMDQTLVDLNLWADRIDPEHGKGAPPPHKGGSNPLPPTPDLAGLEELNNRVAELSAQIVRLENQVLELREGRHTAPFSVVNGAGQPLFAVAADGTVTVGREGQAAIVMKALPSGSALIQIASGPKRLLMVADGSEGAHVQLNDGPDAAVELTASQGNNGFIRVAGGTSSAILNVDPDNAATLNLQGSDQSGVLLSAEAETLGMLVQKAGANAISLGAMPGKGPALRLFNDAGQQVVSAGPNPAKGDAGIVSVGTGGSAAAWLASEADGNGLAQVFAADGTGAAALVAAERAVVAYNAAGSPVATLSKSDKSEGGTVVARNPDGEGIFAAGFAAESGGGEACVWRAKRSNTFCLGIGLPGMGVGK